MTTQQLIWITCGYLVAFVAVVYFTRATARRAFGALVGGAVAGGLFIGVSILGVTIGWWWIRFPSAPGLLALFYVGTAISMSPIYLITWRVARRFGWRGLATCLIAVAMIGPPRDYLIAAVYPEWMVFAPGIAPVLAVSATYVSVVAVGHAVMRLVAGPAWRDWLARLPHGGA
jgi:hypothetical protein